MPNPDVSLEDIEKGKRVFGVEARYNEQEIEARWNKINADLSVFVHDLKQMEKTNPKIAKSGLAKLDNMLNVYADIIETPEKLDPETKQKLSDLRKSYKTIIETVGEGKEIEVVPDVSYVIGSLRSFLRDDHRKRNDFADWMVKDAGYILGPENLKNAASNASYEIESENERDR